MLRSVISVYISICIYICQELSSAVRLPVAGWIYGLAGKPNEAVLAKNSVYVEIIAFAM